MMLGKRKRSNSDGAENEENRNDKLRLKVEKLQKSVDELDQKQEDKIEKILGELQKLNESKKNEELEAEKKPSFNSVISPGSLMKNTPSNGMSPVGKSFILKHVFENVSKMEEGRRSYSKGEDHFGVSWNIHVYRREKHLDFYLHCDKSLGTGRWAIDTKFILKLVRANGKSSTVEVQGLIGNVDENKKSIGWGQPKFISWEEMKKNYLVNNKLITEIYVKIEKMTGVYKEKSRNFDESVKECSDVILKIDNEKFYVAKLFLSFHSTYFKTLFLGQFQESNRSEIELSGIAPEDFQKFLEVLYGDSSIDETTVEAILLIADMYDTQIVIEKCEKFLMNESKKTLKKKLQIAIRYNSDKLKEKCMSDIKTEAHIESVIPENPEELSPSIIVELLKKAISLP